MFALAAVVASAACSDADGVVPTGGERLVVESPDLGTASFSTRSTCDGEDEPPRLSWNEPPAGSQEVLVIVDDQDAPGGSFLHWAVWGLDPDITELAQPLPAEATEGRNGFGDIGYGGPCPPTGDGAHTYGLHVLALDRPVGLEPGAERDEILAAARGHVVASGTIEATYDRSQ